MDTLVKMQGVPEEVLEILVERGYFKTKTEAIRAGILELGEKFGLTLSPKELELNLVALRIKKEQEEMKRKGQRYLSKKEALAKYR